MKASPPLFAVKGKATAPTKPMLNIEWGCSVAYDMSLWNSAQARPSFIEQHDHCPPPWQPEKLHKRFVRYECQEKSWLCNVWACWCVECNLARLIEPCLGVLLSATLTDCCSSSEVVQLTCFESKLCFASLQVGHWPMNGWLASHSLSNLHSKGPEYLQAQIHAKWFMRNW